MTTLTRTLIAFLPLLLVSAGTAFAADHRAGLQVSVSVVRSVQIATTSQGQVIVNASKLAVAPRVDAVLPQAPSLPSAMGQSSGQAEAAPQVVLINF